MSLLGFFSYNVADWSEDLNAVFFPSALIRPGRFDMQVTVPRPDVKGRTEILKWYLKKIKVDSGEWLVKYSFLKFTHKILNY